ncbi:hypothetical protein [Kitasatospora sp. NPDC057738]|uniref:hypothetical protein n=1 Tax=Kitasatospora sp. NPDC057738 TaxID=3346233 RepID=UPI0036A8558B
MAPAPFQNWSADHPGPVLQVDCLSCPALRESVNPPRAERREINLHTGELQQSDEW